MDFPIRSSRTSVETREREPGSRDDRRGDEVCFAATHVFHPRPPACHRSRGRQGQALRVAAKSAAILDRHSTRWRSRTAVGAEEWLRWGQTKEWVRKQVSCQDFVITIREGRHQFSWHKKQEHSRIFPSDTVVVLKRTRSTFGVLGCARLSNTTGGGVGPVWRPRRASCPGTRPSKDRPCDSTIARGQVWSPARRHHPSH